MNKDPVLTRTFRIKRMPLMQLLVIRHAIAEDREEFARLGKPDDQRSLTKKGIRRMQKAARGLKTVVPKIDHIATSPLTRAAETADIVGKVFGLAGVDAIPALVPGAKHEELAAWAQGYVHKGVIAIVGHEPQLGSLVTWFLGGRGESRVELKEGGACLIEFDKAVAAGTATMCWLATPKMLRRMGS